ncbi:type VII secretion-associated protein [Corynebacterium pygosceleis]|uniref:Type VII secretion-associated protein n=1 Tax=Corynebacterium pygosceleis TaxID=2800406 RepID=A0A9Q4C9I1_9CORY|nr:type VII secretion-associated protein [Corynebacterium pygosceleis]MCK7637558.1 type VII secretion-associated protein [Corynebacterium pygosceleis]MCK7674749.1 type VII secretion-associated protein [Corynebacterium pygosceleis]MCL0119662.1 type VII secretion-associated protein [Corynebacterium pygosceleis]MCX7468113.1 type VII secretion-associated protein [Corynebacterium pygosceleis]
MRITILAAATVFELTTPSGEQRTVFRDDLIPDDSPLWLDAVVEQARELVGGSWEGHPVTVLASDTDSADLLTDILLTDGAEVHCDPLRGVVGDDTTGSVDGVRGSGEFAIRRPRSGRRHRARASFRPTLFHVAIVGVVLGVVGFSWWSLGPATGPGGEAGSVVGSGTVRSSPPPTSPAPVTGPDPGTAVSPVQRPGTVVLDSGNISVATPAGYILTPGERGGVTATGPDPDLRIHLAADPAFGAPAAAVLEEVSMRVETDPELHRTDRAGMRPDADAVVTYREDPGDGSFVDWTTWVEGDHQMSVGCHTRITPTVAQRAVCRMAVNSVAPRKEGISEKFPE